MTTLETYMQYGATLEKLLQLPSVPLAIKMVTTEEEIPADALRPKHDQGVHYSLCQAFSLARREDTTVAMLTEDHWCWAPLIGFGLVEFHEDHESFPVMCRFLGIEDVEQTKNFAKNFPRLEYGKYIGLVIAPLKKATFEPDVVLIYTNMDQLKKMLLAVKYKTGELITSQFDAIDSCVYSTIPVIQNGEYRITFPDPGDIERALAADDEVIFSVPPLKLAELISGLEFLVTRKMGNWQRAEKIEPDHPRPDFYRQLYRIWGLDVEGNTEDE